MPSECFFDYEGITDEEIRDELMKKRLMGIKDFDGFMGELNFLRFYNFIG